MGIDNQYVLFKLGQESYAVQMCHVREILKPLPVVKLPGTSDFIKGLASVRESVITILDLRSKFNIEIENAKGEPRFLIFELSDSVIGLWVDDVEQILETTNIDTIPNVIHHGAVHEVINMPEKLVPILDVNRLFTKDFMSWLNDVPKEKSFLEVAASKN